MALHLIATPSRMEDHCAGCFNDAAPEPSRGPREAEWNAVGAGLPLREPRDHLVRPSRLGVFNHAAEMFHRRPEALSETHVITGEAEVVKRLDAGVFERSFIQERVIERVAHLVERAVVARLRGNSEI